MIERSMIDLIIWTTGVSFWLGMVFFGLGVLCGWFECLVDDTEESDKYQQQQDYQIELPEGN